MTPRDAVGLVVASVLVGEIVVGVAAAQTRAAGRTPWGHPDLQGVWTGSTMTPLQRPERLAGKEFLTADEASRLERDAEATRFTDREPPPGEPGTYNQLWMEPSTRVLPDRRTALIVDPKDGRIPFRAEAAKHDVVSSARYGVGPFDDFASLDTGERCLTDGVPIPYFTGYNNNIQVFQTERQVVIVGEMYGNRRIIPLGAEVRSDVPQWLGQSKGRWEGDTLVVETTHFADKAHYWWASSWRASRSTLRVVERFTRVDEQTIDYQFTMEDPAMFTRPWTARYPLTKDHTVTGSRQARLFEYACHEGNQAMTNILRGAREEERQRLGK